MSKLNKAKQKLELSLNQQIIFDVTGYKAKLFRPPFGSYNNDLISTCKDLNITPVQWSVDSLDWKGISAGEISSRVCSKIKNGSIVLFHNNSECIINGLKMVLEYLTKNNYKIVPVGEILYKENFKINSQGVQTLNHSEI